MSVDAPLSNSALCVFGTASRVIQVKARNALVAVSSLKVECFAVYLTANTWTEAQVFSLLTACEGRDFLEALSVPDCVACVFAGETVA